jgi:predicted RNA-binding Zn-ribbon protein involved in translation (DUF1610 family)
MKTEDLRLDGNAIAGMLSEMLSVEATTIIARCGSCGAEGALGAAHVYLNCPGVVVRCAGCGEALMRFAHIRGHLVADLHGAGRLTI